VQTVELNGRTYRPPTRPTTVVRNFDIFDFALNGIAP